KEAKASLFDYIELFYNRQRRHSALQYMNPCQYEVFKMAA
ncbi:MAG: IS3 family transposase, partial [Thermodesulfobacteriota bacterium]|nr:IS3 family transposase [Thermodesulfobacteriota bacterium]MDY6856903.1 IS3 family transposase [Thermodesulfobacteriota bacterium]